MRARAPNFEGTSQKSVQDIAGCIGSKLNPAKMPISSFPIEHGTSFVLGGGMNNADITIDVIDLGAARSVRFYSRKFPISFIPNKSIEGKLQSCL